MTPAYGAWIAAIVESMYTDGVLQPPLPPDMAKDWQLIDYLTARDALLGLQRIGLGEQVFFGFLARSKADPLQYVVAIRGTERADEWVIDAEATLVNHLHLGFNSIYLSMLFRSVHPAAGITAATPPSSTLTIVGHSLGAPLACYLLNDLMGLRDCFGLFYAMPKPGDATFAAAFKASEARYNVYNYDPDAVPKMPPFSRFVPLPNVHTIPASPKIPDNLIENHRAANYAALLT